jgi:DNA-binding NarL/FixJ family response regulator
MVHYNLLEYHKTTGVLMRYQKNPEDPVMVNVGGQWVPETQAEPTNRKLRKTVTPTLRAQVVKLLRAGKKNASIGRDLDLSAATVGKIKKEEGL